MARFGQQLRRLRMRAGLGLRTFAELIAERTSLVSAIELGHRTPWHRADKLERVADVLGLVTGTPFCDDFFVLARNEPSSTDGTSSTLGAAATNGHRQQANGGSLAWWWTTDNAPLLEDVTVDEMAEFIGAFTSKVASNIGSSQNLQADRLAPYPALTELAAEWRVRQLLGRRESPLAAAPVDVEAVLEQQGDVRIEVIAGLVPRFSVQACAVIREKTLVLLVDRIVSDSRPLASYRELLAQLYAPAALWVSAAEPPSDAWFARLQQHEEWPQLLRDCQRFALSMLLPAGPLLAAAEVAYREVVEQQGWVDTDVAARSVRNRLAEQFAVPPLLVHTRLVRWPCHVYGRIAQALAAEELTLPPVDWFEEEPASVSQRLLFDKI